MPTFPISEGGSLFCKHFCLILTPNLASSLFLASFCDIEVACHFEILPIFCSNPHYFLGADVGISGMFVNK